MNKKKCWYEKKNRDKKWPSAVSGVGDTSKQSMEFINMGGKREPPGSEEKKKHDVGGVS